MGVELGLSPKWKDERRLSVFEDRVLRRMFRPKMTREQGNGVNYVTRSLMICTARAMLLV
jgi:hypothetical protein